MSETTRQSILEQAAKKLRADFAELTVVPHRGAKGHEAEGLVKTFLRNHLPKRFDVGAGFILDKTNNASRQTDVIIFDALNCPVYRYSDDAAIFPSDNVAAVVEVKSTLDKSALHDAFEKIAVIKSLTKTKPPPLPMPIMCQTFGHVFAFGSPLNLNTLLEHYAEFIREFGLGRHVDFVTILDTGMLTIAAQLPQIPGWAPTLFESHVAGQQSEGVHFAASAARHGPDTLDAFLRMLLAHLIHFRGLVDHPGFDWSQTHSKGKTLLHYVGSITCEQDPIKKGEILKGYAEKVRAEFEASPMPKDF